MSVSGIVLCGGKSSRMGRPKALLRWRGRSLVETVVDVLRGVVDEVVVVTSGAFPLPPLPARVVNDRAPELGPLGGLRDGLHAVGGGLAFATGTDVPFLTERFVRSMLAFGGPAALELDGHLQTLGAVYDADRAAEADALLASGRPRPLFLLEASGYRKVQPGEVDDPECTRGFNRPEEYLAALRAAGVEGGGVVELLGRARRRAGRSRLDVPVGTLAEVLRHVEPFVPVWADGAIDRQYLVSLNARGFVRDASIPIGPGDRVIVMDSSVGG